VAAERVISTVDSEARHGHKTAARGFDGYKGHVGIDPDSEIITDTEVSPGNAGDASVAADLIDDLTDDTATAVEPAPLKRRSGGGRRRPGRNKKGAARRAKTRRAARRVRLERRRSGAAAGTQRRTVYGDCAYGSGEFLQHLADRGIESRCKTQPPAPLPGGLFTKDSFQINLADDTVTCPAEVTVTIRRGRAGDGTAYFADACHNCALRVQCTNSASGRTITINRYEPQLADARREQQWASPQSVEASSMRSSDARDTTEVRPRVP
jgi:hypothetical protein